jgi:hypothetical protein
MDAPPPFPRPVGGPLSGCCCRCPCLEGTSPAGCPALRCGSAAHSVATGAGGPCVAARGRAAAGATPWESSSPEAPPAAVLGAAATRAPCLATAAAMSRGGIGGAAASNCVAAALSTEATGDRASPVPPLSRRAGASRLYALDCPAPPSPPAALGTDTEAAGSSVLGSPPWLLTPLSAPLS